MQKYFNVQTIDIHYVASRHLSNIMQIVIDEVDIMLYAEMIIVTPVEWIIIHHT